MALNSRPQLPTRCACQLFSTSNRAFSTCLSRSSSIPPESPRFIEVPHPPQRFAEKQVRVRGKLPVPRNLFPKGTKEKASPLYLDAVTPEPTRRKLREEPGDEAKYREHFMHSQWNRKMAEKRRMNLREGILEMHNREAESKELADRRAEALKRRRMARENAPPRSDELFTGPSITEVLRDIYKRDQYWTGKDVALKKANVEKLEKRRAEEQADAIHTLYMHARDFITNEEQLDIAIEEAFGPNDDPILQSIWDRGNGDNIPKTTADMLQMSHGTNNVRSIDVEIIRGKIANDRMTKIAEALTGGKMNTDRESS